jgi:hypothetical protein
MRFQDDTPLQLRVAELEIDLARTEQEGELLLNSACDSTVRFRRESPQLIRRIKAICTPYKGFRARARNVLSSLSKTKKRLQRRVDRVQHRIDFWLSPAGRLWAWLTHLFRGS